MIDPKTMSRPKKARWGTEHRRHALARLHELQGLATRRGVNSWGFFTEILRCTMDLSYLTEHRFRSLLIHAPISPDRFECEVDDVLAAADGQIVWTTEFRWRVYDPDGDVIIETPAGAAKPDEADLVDHLHAATGDGRCRIVRVKTTRRSVRRALA